MRITIEQVTKQIEEFLTECDLDELGRITGEIFGGKCFPVIEDENDLGWDMVLDFEPDENYYGAFDKK